MKNLVSLFLIFFTFPLFSSNVSEFFNPNAPELVVVLMVKNEESVIVETVEPFVQAGVKAFFIYDTGSTDNTVGRIKEYFEENKEIQTCIIEEPFVDFSTSRNRALDLAYNHFNDSPFFIMIDAEWYIINARDLVACCKEICSKQDFEPFYNIRIGNDSIDFKTPRLFFRNSMVRFVGRVHECTTMVPYASVPDHIMFYWNPSRQGIEKSQQRYTRDLQLLLLDFHDDPQNPRTLFYLAQTYECLGDYKHALHFYHQRALLDVVPEETFMAWYRMGQIAEQSMSDEISWSFALYYYLKAFSCRPHRAEPLVRIAQYYISKDNHDLAFLFAKHACEIPYPAYDYLFIDKELYDYTRFEILSRSAWYMQHYELGEMAAIKAVQSRPYLPHVYTNLAWYSDRKIQMLPNECQELPLVVIVPSFNNKMWFKKNLDSILSQKYQNFKVIYIDDSSDDGMSEEIENYLRNNPMQDKIVYYRNQKRVGALENIFNAVHSCNPSDIILLVDGDDWLDHDNVFNCINKEYQNSNVWMTYGQFVRTDNDTYISSEIPLSIIMNKKIREYPWTASHLRTFYAGLFHKIKKEDLFYEGSFFPVTWDLAIMFPMLEMAGVHSKFIPEVHYVYNAHNPINDDKINFSLQQRCDILIRQKLSYNFIEKLF